MLTPSFPPTRFTAQRVVASLLLTALVAGCGGGAGGDAGTASSTPATPAAAPAPASAPASAPPIPTLTVRARAQATTGDGALMNVLVDGTVIGTAVVRSSEFADYSFSAAGLRAGAAVDVVFASPAVAGQERSLFVAYVSDGANVTMLPAAADAVFDRGEGTAAFDGNDLLPGQSELWWAGALRLKWPAVSADATARARRYAASRLLQQATFGPTGAEVERVAAMTPEAWIAEQQALPYSTGYAEYVQSQYAKGDAYRPQGAQYTPAWIGQRFWASAATSPDQLRRRVGYALHHIFMASQVDSNLHFEARAYGAYLDTLNKNAFGNFRQLLEEVVLSPVMGIYLSHMRNRKEDPAAGRTPDENCAREVMQLFTIGLHQLNVDGSLKLGSNGKPIETYTNDDVMAMAKVFTGWSWAFPDNQLTENNFLWASPDTSAARDQRIDTLKMRAYPGQHSPAEKRLFAGTAQAVTIPANSSAETGMRMALDALFKHPNVGPFIGRLLIQRLVTSNPKPAYVARVATVFNNNGQGVRGDLAAVVRAVLLDEEARQAPTAGFGVLREPVLRVTHWMRAFGATSRSGDYMMAWDLEDLSQRVMFAPSVFGYFRPGYVPPNTQFSASGATAPEFQLVNESTTASWVNTVDALVGAGLGWTGSTTDVSTQLSALVDLATRGDGQGLLEHLNLLLFAGRMSPELRQDILDAVGGVGLATSTSQLNRARVALLLALASPEYLAQR